jgi:hypothetical protein
MRNSSAIQRDTLRLIRILRKGARCHAMITARW